MFINYRKWNIYVVPFTYVNAYRKVSSPFVAEKTQAVCNLKKETVPCPMFSTD